MTLLEILLSIGLIITLASFSVYEGIVPFQHSLAQMNSEQEEALKQSALGKQARYILPAEASSTETYDYFR